MTHHSFLPALLGIISAFGTGIASAAPVKEAKEVAAKDWPLVSLTVKGKAVELPATKPISIRFDEKGKVTGKSAVNRFFSSATLDGKGGCKIGGVGATRMAGPPAMMDLERSYFQVLSLVATIDLSDDTLTLSSADGKSTALFGKTVAKGDDKADPGPSVVGQVVFEKDPGAKLAPGTIIKVSLQDVSLADAAAKVLGKVVIDDATEFPVPFKIPYDPASIKKGMRYSVSARIEHKKKLQYINDTSHPVFSDGKKAPKSLDLRVISIR